MRNFIFLLSFLFASFCWALIPNDQQTAPTVNLLQNPGFELGKTKWVNSGGTFAVTPATSSIPFGGNYATFTASSTGQYVESAAYPVPLFMQGGSCLVRLPYLGGSANLKIQVLDGSSVLVSSSPASELVLATATGAVINGEVGFKCPSSGSIKIRIISTAASAAINFDNVLVGGEDRFFRASQASLMGTMTISGCSSFFSNASGSFAVFPAQTGCTYTATGALSAPSTMIPGFKSANLPKGEYLIVFDGSASESSAASSFRMSDGTGVSRETAQLQSPSTNSTFTYSFGYTSDQTNVTFQMQAFNSTSSTSYIYVSGTSTATFKLYRFPTTTQDLYFQTQAPNDLVYERQFSAVIAQGTSTTACTTSPCTVYQQTPATWLSSVTRTTTGSYVMNFVAGIFTSPPMCLATSNNGAPAYFQSPSSSSVNLFVVNNASGGGAVDSIVNVTCFRAVGDYINKIVAAAYVPTSIRSAKIQEQQSSGTAGGGSSTGYQTRVLNTVASDPNSIVVSLTSNQFVLNPGTYHIHASLPSNGCNGNRGRLRNVTDSTNAVLGLSGYSGASSANNFAFIDGTFSIASQKTFSIQHYCGTAQATNGYGIAAGSGDVEIYTDVDLQKLD